MQDGWIKLIFKWSRWVVVLFLMIGLSTYGWWGFNTWGDTEIPHKNGLLVSNLKRHVYFLSEEVGVRNYMRMEALNKSADYIKEEFKQMGLTVEEISYEVNGKNFRNIVAMKEGGLDSFRTAGMNPRVFKSKPPVLLGAHYDSCFNPGADDNASGVAGMIEIARKYTANEKAKGIIFAAFVNEEPPFFNTPQMGSYVVAEHFSKQGIVLRAAVVLEMIGYYTNKAFSQRYLPFIGLFFPNQGNFIAVVSNFPSWGDTLRFEKGFKQRTTFPIRSLAAPSKIHGIYYSDHASFWKMGYPAMMITDTAFLRNKHYHQMTDRMGTLDFNHMATVVEGIAAGVNHLYFN